MNWLAWRQFRNQFMILGLLLIGFTILVVLSGNHFWHEYQHTLATCRQNPATPSCSDISDSLGQAYGVLVKVVFLTGICVPLLLGLFLGSPLFSREYEEGTNKLVWTQSVSRRKWLTVKLAWALVFAALYGLAISLLVSWWARTPNALNNSRFDAGQFDAFGIMPLAYTIFFTAAGFTMSAWFRKTLIAFAITLGLFIAFQTTVGQLVRPHYMKPATVTAAMGPNQDLDLVPAGAWVITRNIVNGDGKVIGDIFPAAPSQCQQVIQQSEVGTNGGGIRVKSVPGGGDPIDACLNKAGFHQVATYQPSYRYWDFQRIETGIYLGMTAIAVGATYWLVLKRDA